MRTLATALNEELASLRGRLAATEVQGDRLLSSLAIDRSVAERPEMVVYPKPEKRRSK